MRAIESFLAFRAAVCSLGSLGQSNRAIQAVAVLCLPKVASSITTTVVFTEARVNGTEVPNDVTRYLADCAIIAV
jgi:hypothetical protein